MAKKKDGTKTKKTLSKLDKGYIDMGKSEVVYNDLINNFNVEPERAQKMIYNYQQNGKTVK